MNVFIFEFVNPDGDFDYRVVHGDDYRNAMDLFVSKVCDYKEIMHVYVRVW